MFLLQPFENTQGCGQFRVAFFSSKLVHKFILLLP
jgi:hypothetical protein